MGLRALQKEYLEPGVLQVEQRPHKQLQDILRGVCNTSLNPPARTGPESYQLPNPWLAAIRVWILLALTPRFSALSRSMPWEPAASLALHRGSCCPGTPPGLAEWQWVGSPPLRTRSLSSVCLGPPGSRCTSVNALKGLIM